MPTEKERALAFLSSLPSRRLQPPDQPEEPEEKSLISRFFSGAADVGTEIVKDIVAVPGRIASIPQLIRKESVGFESEKERSELRKKALGGAFDIASFFFPAGRIAKGIGIAGKGIAKTAGRGALAAVKTSPLITPRETAGDPVARAKDVAFQSTIGAAAPVVTSKVISPLASKAQAGIAKVFEKGAATRAAKLTRRENAKLVRNLLSSKGITEASEKTFPKLFDRILNTIDDVTVRLTQAEKVFLSEAPTIATTGTVTKAARVGKRGKIIKSTAPLDVPTKEFPKMIARGQEIAAEVTGQLDAIIEKIIQGGEVGIGNQGAIFAQRIKVGARTFFPARSQFGRGGLQLQKETFEELKDIALGIQNLGVIQERLPIMKELWNRVRDEGMEGFFQKRTLNDGIRLWTVNVFPIFSGLRDLLTNLGSAGSDALQTVGADLFDFTVKGKLGFDRSAAIFKAIRKTGRQLPAGIKNDPTALGERLVPIFGNKFDNILFFPAKAKGAVDSFFKRYGAWASLYEEGLKRIPKGTINRKAAIEKFIFSADDKVLAEASERGGRLGFNRVLSQFEESVAGNPLVRLFVNPFPRWTFQFTRFLAEHTPIDPKFWSLVKANKATAEDFTKFLVRNMTGTGGLLATSSLLYDQVDFKTMDYVREDGSRIKLTGLTPVPDALFMVAILRGDAQNAFRAMTASSVALPAGQTGIASALLGTGRDFYTGQINTKTVSREIKDIANDFIPGRGMLMALEQISDPEIREGFFKDVPGLSKLGPLRIDPTTGETIKPKTTIPFFDKAQLPKRFPRGLPGGGRVVNDIERELFRVGLGTRRPRRIPILEFTEEAQIKDKPVEVQEAFERRAGALVNQAVSRAIQSSGYRGMPDEQKKRFLSSLIGRVRTVARNEVLRDFGFTNTSANRFSRALRSQVQTR